jgi:hypothetical protein
MKRTLRFLCIPLDRARRLRADDRGQTMLLSGMMVFLIAIMAMVTLDTGQGIYNRIIAQNAADSAADAAALWHARGCNLLQHLNNIHYDGDALMFAAELSMLGACQGGALQYFPITAAVGEAACLYCGLADDVDKAQEKFNSIILDIQSIAAEIFPALAFVYANACAMGSGADPFGDVLGTYPGSLLHGLNIDIPGLEDVLSFLGGVIDEVPGFCAMILDPTALSLHVDKKEAGELDIPWTFPWELAWFLAVPAGELCIPNGFDESYTDWGWQDSYYHGNPGFMTWVAGKAGTPDPLGLGGTAWMSPGSRSYQEMVDTYSKTFYTGPLREGTSDELKIPACLGIASSQIEGEPVISYGEADAEPKIITVQFGSDDDPTAGTGFLIYH